MSKHRMISMIEEYLAYRRSMGFKISDDKAGAELRGFGRYAEQIGHHESITTDLAVQWAKHTRNSTPIHAARRLDMIRGFAQYRALFDPNTEVPPKGILGPSQYPRRAPYIYSDDEIRALLKVAKTVRPKNGLRPKTYVTIFALLACSGIRVSEALALTDADVNMQDGLLRINCTKFKKSRLVPLHPSSLHALSEYRNFRNDYLQSQLLEAFFVNEDGTRLHYYHMRQHFKNFRCKLGWTENGRTRTPRIHDLRHTFAVKCLQRWYEEGADVDQKILTLATYLGHVNVTKTYWYLTAVPELMTIIGKRFEKFSHIQSGGDA